MTPRYGLNLMGWPIIGVAHTHVIGQGHRARGTSIMPTCGDQPADVFLQIPFLYEALNLIPQLESFECVMPPILVKLAVLHHVPSFCGGSYRARTSEQVFPFHLHEDLFPRCVKWGVAIKAAREGLRGRAR